MKRTPFLFAGGAIVIVIAVVALLAPLIAPYAPLAPTGPSLAPPSWHHLLGTNDSGEDLLSQLIWGARASALVAVAASALAVALGLLLGGGAGLAGGATDLAAMRAVDVFLALPALPLVIVIAAFVGPSRGTVVAVIGIAGAPGIARIVRSRALELRQRGYVRAARGLGAGRLYLLRRHVLPALAPVAAATFIDWAAAAVVLQAGLAFLGLGDPTEVSWGGIINRALGHEGVYFTSEWLWWVLPAGLAVSVAVVGLAFLGLAVEPRSRT